MEEKNILGIVAEYNPFHCGHKYHIDESHKSKTFDATVAIMSGCFTQRGEPAIIDKYTRASMAIRGGVDLVIELPTYFATQSSDYFTFGAMKILNDLNIIDSISFGTESESIESVKSAAQILIEHEAQIYDDIRELMRDGTSLAAARIKALGKFLEPDELELFTGSNNILAIDYIKHLIKLNSNIEPMSVNRASNKYNDRNLPLSETSLASAASIREVLRGKQLGVLSEKHSEEITEDQSRIHSFVDDRDFDILRNGIGKYVTDLEDGFAILKYRLINEGLYPDPTSPDLSSLKDIQECNEGVENLLFKNVMKAASIDELIEATKTRRYSESKLKRAICGILLDIRKDTLSELYNNKHPLYLRALAANKKGLKLLGEISRRSDIPILTKSLEINAFIDRLRREDPESPVLECIRCDLRAEKLYSIYIKDSQYLDDVLIQSIRIVNG